MGADWNNLPKNIRRHMFISINTQANLGALCLACCVYSLGKYCALIKFVNMLKLLQLHTFKGITILDIQYRHTILDIHLSEILKLQYH